jgi:hypothetical protein
MKCPLFSSDFSQDQIVSASFTKFLNVKFNEKYFLISTVVKFG